MAASRADASPAPVAAPSPGPASAPAPYAPPSFGARYLDNPKPAYPMVARRRGLEGTVRLEVRVSAEGIPTSVKVRDSAGHEALDEAATTAVWHWRFVPARRGGEAVEGVVVVPIRFRLGGLRQFERGDRTDNRDRRRGDPFTTSDLGDLAQRSAQHPHLIRSRIHHDRGRGPGVQPGTVGIR